MDKLGAYNVHPVADLFPLIEGDAFDELVRDIKANGLLEPITLSPDGHRARAVSPMQLKDVLGEIESDGAHRVHGCLLEWPATPSLWHAEAVGGVHMG